MDPIRTTSRVQALDVARGIAVFGMIFMNFKIAVLSDFQEGYSFPGSQEGRFGALFIFLAGMGISLMNRNACDNPDLLWKNRIKLAKRALYLFAIGMLFSYYWQADIFHFYAFYILMAIPLIRLSGRTLFRLAFLPPLIFTFLSFSADWELGWNWNTMQYSGFYTPSGFFRNLFFNGYHPIFPWFSFLLTGMSMGKSDLNSRSVQILNCIISAVVFAVTETATMIASIFWNGPELSYLISTRAMPPFPLFVISAGAQNILILNLTLLLTARVKPGSGILSLLSETGKMVMSHYVQHLILGLIPLFLIAGMLKIGGLFIFVYSTGYFILTVALTFLWRRKFPHGPSGNADEKADRLIYFDQLNSLIRDDFSHCEK